MAAPAHAATSATLDADYNAEAVANPERVARTVYGSSRGGRPLTVYRVGKGAPRSKPVVLYVAAQNGADETAADVQLQLFQYVANNPGSLLDKAELWFVPVADPDGYDGAGNGVNFDRNWPYRWGYDREGATDSAGPGYRGPSPRSEPEVAALSTLIDSLRPRHLLEYRGGADGRISYPESWQIQTPATDAPALAALAGSHAAPAIAGYVPGPAGERAISNGTLIDNVYRRHGTQAFTVQIPGADAAAEYAKSREFALDLARSAPDPSRPVSHLGNTAPDFVPHTFGTSYGSPQLVEVNARKALGPVHVAWRVNGGAKRTKTLTEYEGGDRYGAPGGVYHRMRGEIDGFRKGDNVQVWFEGGGAQSSTFTFAVAVTAPGHVLVLAAEDYSGTHPGPVHPGPEYLSAYTEALAALGISYDVYDVDARGRIAPDPVGVLSHYGAVVWYTGDDVFVREPSQPGGTGTSKLFGDEILALRDHLNDGGRLLVSGQQALMGAWAQLVYDPISGHCTGNNLSDLPADTRCVAAADDFLQYYLGAWSGGPAAADQQLRAGAAAFTLDTDLQWGPTRYFATSNLLAPSAFPQFASTRYAGFDRESDFAAVSGSRSAHAASVDEGWQRLTRTIDLTSAASASLAFQISYDVDPGFDFVFVEAHEVGEDDDWTTLPDRNDHTSQDTGYACDPDPDYSWSQIHAQLEHYQDADCDPSGTTGDWNAATGDSQGFQEWDVDLSDWAGKQVEVSITYAQDWATGGLGVYVDDARVTRDAAVIETKSFEVGLGAWTSDSWTVSTGANVVEGLGIATARTLLWGFGLEGVNGAASRKALLGDALKYLNAVPAPPPVDPPPPPPEPETPQPPAPTPTPDPPAKQPKAPQPKPKLAVGSKLTTDSRGRAKVRVRCAGRTACKGVLKLMRGKVEIARGSYSLKPGRSGSVTLKLNAKARKHKRLTLRLYNGVGRSARLSDSSTVTLKTG